MLYSYFDLFASFQCQMCGVCCRNDWMVTVDEASYQRNSALFLQTGRADEFHKAFIPITSASLGEYARIAKQPQGECWFLKPDNLCRLHQEVGHNQLDVVCQTFPRYPMGTARGIELTLSFSCPTVVKLASESYVAVIRSENRPVNLYSTNFVTEVYPQQYPKNTPLHFYFELEQHFINILQWRNIPMEQRIHFLCKTADRIGSLQGDDTGRELNRIINRDYAVLDSLGSYDLSPDASAILVENFFVNCIFKKLLYVHGLKSGADLLKLFWQHIQIASGNIPNRAVKWEQICSAIIELEFEYSHHRSRFLKRVT